jgi:hypothetical protein
MPKKNKGPCVRPTFIIDTREQQSPLVPGAYDEYTCEIGTLKTGDYIIKEAPELVVIERKKNGREIYGNLLRKNKAGEKPFYKEIDRMSIFSFKYIVIDENYEDFLDPHAWTCFLPYRRALQAIAMVETSLIQLRAKYNIHFIFAGECTGRLIKKLLLKHWEYKDKYGSKHIPDGVSENN